MRNRAPSEFEEFGLEFEEDDEVITPSPSKPGALPEVRKLWSPRPLSKPAIDPALRYLGWWERSAEVIRFTVLCLEHWLSQSGTLREWLRLNLWVAAVLVAAAILIIPSITAVLEGAAEFTGLFGKIVENMTNAALKLPPVVLGIATLLVVFRVLFRQWKNRRRGGYGQRELDEYQ